MKAFVAGLAVAAMASGAARAAIGFNFSANRTDNQAAPIEAGEQNPLAPADVAGAPAYRFAFWNNLASDFSGVAGAVPSPLVDSFSNAIAGLSVEYNAPNTWDTGSAPATPDGWMMRNYLDSNPGTSNQPYLSVVGIPYAKYSVVVYADGDGTDGRVAQYWITDNGATELTPRRFLQDTANFTGTYVRVSESASSAGAAAPGNCLVFQGLTNPNIRVCADEVSGATPRAPLNGVQIVPWAEGPEAHVVTLTPLAASNTLNITIRAVGSITANLGFPIGTVTIPIDSSDSENARLGGTQPLLLEADFDPRSHLGIVTGLECVDGDVNVTNTLNFDLNLGTYIIVQLGHVYVTGSGLGGRLDTPYPLSQVTGGTTFPVADHELILNEGMLTGYATGIAADYMAPFTNNLATDPLVGPVGAGSGTVTLSAPTVGSTTVTYAVAATIPVNVTYQIMDDGQGDPVDVFATVTGTTRWEGTLTRPRPATDVSAVWARNAGGNWSVDTNWLGSLAATGTAGVACFTNGITGNRTVTVNTSPWTIHGLTFRNTAAYGWTVAGGTLNLAGADPVVRVHAASTATVASVISGSAGLTKASSGTLILTGTNSYSGGTTIAAGTLQVGAGGGSGSVGAGPITNQSVLAWNNTNGLTVNSNNAMVGAGSLTILAGNVNVRYDIGGRVSSGAITVDDGGSGTKPSFEIWAPGAVTLTNDFALDGMGSATNRAAINHDGGAGLVTLNGRITLAGDSRIGAGGTSWNNMTLNGKITGPGRLHVFERNDNGAGKAASWLQLTGNANDYAGGTVIEQGRLIATTAAALGSGAVIVTNANSQLLIDAVSDTIGNDFVLGGGGNPFSRETYAYGNGTLVFHNEDLAGALAGTVTLAGDAKIRNYGAYGVTVFEQGIGGHGNLIFEAGGADMEHVQIWVLGGSAASTYDGSTRVRSDGNANALLLLYGGALPSGTVLTLEDQSTRGGHVAIFDLNGQDQTLAGLTRIAGSGGAGSFINNSGGFDATLTVSSAADCAFSGVIGKNTFTGSPNIIPGDDNIALAKAGSGVFTLSGSNTYVGATTVRGGKLLVNGWLAGGGEVTVSGGTLGGTGTIAGAVAVENSGVLAPGVSAGVLTLQNGLALSALSRLDFELGANSDRLVVTGGLALGGRLRVVDSGGFGAGVYTLIHYTGARSGTAPAIESAPTGYVYEVDASSHPGEVRLVVSVPNPLTPFQQWQVRFFGSTNDPNAGIESDPDGDGFNNGCEFGANTNPTNMLSLLQITQTVLDGADLRLEWKTAGVRTNRVQVGDDLMGTNFIDISGPIVLPLAGDVTTNFVIVGGATNPLPRLYRVRVP